MSWWAVALALVSSAAPKSRQLVLELKPACGAPVLLELTVTRAQQLETCLGPVVVGFTCEGSTCRGEARAMKGGAVVELRRDGGTWVVGPANELAVKVLGESELGPTPRTLRVSLATADAQAATLLPPGESWRVRLPGCAKELMLSHRLNATGALELMLAQGKRAPLVTETDLGRDVVLIDGCKRAVTARLELPPR